MKILELVNEGHRRRSIVNRLDRFADIVYTDAIAREVAQKSDHHVDIVYPG